VSRRTPANRLNALWCTGPRTPAGKAISRLNSAKHGIISGLRVLPTVEKQQDWEIHLARMMADLKPMGYLETSLAERIALFPGGLAGLHRTNAKSSLSGRNLWLKRSRSHVARKPRWTGCLRPSPRCSV